MQFTPDYRNTGGRYMILSQVLSHRVCLQQIKERQSQSYRSPRQKNKSDLQNYEHEKNLAIHHNKIKEILCLTDRGQKLPYFFRRIPSPVNHLKLLHKKSLTTKQKTKHEKVNIAVEMFVPQTCKSTVNWKSLIDNLNGVQYPIRNFVRDLAFSYKIYDDSDFAILIRLLCHIYKLNKSTLVNYVAEIIEELER